MTPEEDFEWELLERRLKKAEEERQQNTLTRANIAAAEFISTQTPELLAITTIRKAFEYGYRTGYRTGWRDRDASKEDK